MWPSSSRHSCTGFRSFWKYSNLNTDLHVNNCITFLWIIQLQKTFYLQYLLVLSKRHLSGPLTMPSFCFVKEHNREIHSTFTTVWNETSSFLSHVNIIDVKSPFSYHIQIWLFLENILLSKFISYSSFPLCEISELFFIFEISKESISKTIFRKLSHQVLSWSRQISCPFLQGAFPANISTSAQRCF